MFSSRFGQYTDGYGWVRTAFEGRLGDLKWVKDSGKGMK